MLNKIKWGGLIAAIIMLIRMFLPDVKIPEGFQNAIMLIIIFVSQFFVREDEVTVSRLKLKKKIRLPASVLFLPLLFFAFGTAPASAQELDLKDLAVGGGSAFGEEGETFNTSALFGAVQWRGLKLPMRASTGVALEFSAQPNAEDENRFTVTMWLLNRVGERLFAGTDLKIMENTKSDFDLRVVTGVLLGTIRGRELVLEIYGLEEDRAISFGFFYRF